MSNLEQEFHLAMIDIYRRAKEECGYPAPRFLSMVAENGGLRAAKRLLAPNAVQYGFTELWERGRLDITMEAHVIDPKFQELFTPEEIERARVRLRDHGYEV